MQEGRSNTESAVADENRDLIGVGWSISCGIADDIGRHIKVGQCHRCCRKNDEGGGYELVGSFCRLLVFVQLDVRLSVFTTAVFERHAMPVHAVFGHSALATVPAVFIDQAPGKEFAHAVMQVDRGPHRGRKVDEG
jgi:hypothetical protein